MQIATRPPREEKIRSLASLWPKVRAFEEAPLGKEQGRHLGSCLDFKDRGDIVNGNATLTMKKGRHSTH
jgi:hypothetical protein